jgi:myo-inositol-1(or 4)-monophosphatase
MASDELRVAIDAARRAGDLLRSELRGPRRIAFKGAPTNLVTEMDSRAEALIVDALRGTFPDDAILAEERGSEPGRSGRRWIIDPLDGTTNYAHGVPIFAVSIALEAGGRIVAGVVFDPNQGELFTAERGHGAFVNGQRLAVSSTLTLNESLLATGFPYNVRETPDNNFRQYTTFSLRTQGVRRMGSAVLYLAYVAAGRIDGYWELRLGSWDAAAGSLMVEEAGGRVSDLVGGPLDIDAPTIVASNGRVHDEIVRTLAEISRS